VRLSSSCLKNRRLWELIFRQLRRVRSRTFSGAGALVSAHDGRSLTTQMSTARRTRSPRPAARRTGRSTRSATGRRSAVGRTGRPTPLKRGRTTSRTGSAASPPAAGLRSRSHKPLTANLRATNRTKRSKGCGLVAGSGRSAEGRSMSKCSLGRLADQGHRPSGRHSCRPGQPGFYHPCAAAFLCDEVLQRQPQRTVN
jgi:hypothetical protein